ncbi:hypothetical protein I6F07_21285 [Ensifer sp. IC4062]|nr:hypothetical protein [Ensifer sp. IC4062]MCA1442707.1 hypothetical protein [Ensifer sp. IC4062]
MPQIFRACSTALPLADSIFQGTPKSCPNLAAIHRCVAPTSRLGVRKNNRLKNHTSVTQPLRAPKFCRAQFLQHATKPRFFEEGRHEAVTAGFQGVRRLGAVQHDSSYFSVAPPYFFFAHALVYVSRAQDCSVETAAAEALPDRE